MVCYSPHQGRVFFLRCFHLGYLNGVNHKLTDANAITSKRISVTKSIVKHIMKVLSRGIFFFIMMPWNYLNTYRAEFIAEKNQQKIYGNNTDCWVRSIFWNRPRCLCGRLANLENVNDSHFVWLCPRVGRQTCNFEKIIKRP